MFNKKFLSVVALSFMLSACGGGGDGDGGSNGGNNNGGNNNGGGTVTPAPTITITSNSKPGVVFGGEKLELAYVVANGGTSTSRLMVTATSDSSAASVTVDAAASKAVVTTSVVTQDTPVNIVLTVSDGQNSSQATHSLTLTSYSAEYNELTSAIATVKGFLTASTIKNEDVNTITTLGTIAMTNGAITADDFELAKQALIAAHDSFTNNALSQLANFEASLASTPSNAASILPTFNNWKDQLMANFAPDAFGIINNLAQKAGVSGLVDASVGEPKLISGVTRFVDRTAYLDNVGQFLKEFEWLYATQDGKKTRCVL